MWCRFVHFNLGAHFLDLRGLLFDRCRETRNRIFQFRDSLLRVEEVVERNFGSRYSHLVPVGVDGVGPQLPSVIDEHEGEGTRINVPIEVPAIKVSYGNPKTGVVADADEFQFIRSTGLHLCADIDVTFAIF